MPVQAASAERRLRPGVAELERTGGRFLAAGSERAFLFMDAALDQRQQQAIVATFNESIADVEREFAHRFARSPAVYVFGTSERFNRALVGVFGYPGAVADALSREHGGALLPGIDAAVVNWESARGDVRIIRHELVHAAIREIAGPGTVPAWLDEGLATLALDLGQNEASERDRYAVRSLADSGKLTLTGLRFAGPLTHLDYVAAEEAADMFKSDVGIEGLRRILAATGAGAFP